ncbi:MULTISPECIES: Ppx/GppA phosphatase family protein [Helicobacter]|uniref:Ppx/GppA phosphatase family protein n=1 Tax=Helicobacter ibis TaxID=2962633 RepID=A0ABT4VCP2_9HELI|nr:MULTISPECIES: Ppx/GppA phosphatase family protein [Helicobacter]MDA3966753.1 Ppx/GppA phosphatase family protein [Helicobacter sp. WB40]MDA3968465.1 Ppx/GppA phosphatase family protein [Helicobacter ibis]
MAKITAVIDIGSNSARMAIFEKTSHFGFHLIYETKSKVRISENSYQNNGYLQKEPISRTIDALQDFLNIAKYHKARKIFCVATSAVRDAPNKNILLAEARKIGLNIKVINGESEAYFGAIAALNLLHFNDGITIDIGGGSTECALIKEGKIIDKISLNLGTIRLKELFFDKLDYNGAYKFVKDSLSQLPEHFKHKRVFAIGGTARALSKAILKHTKYPLNSLHGFSYPFLEHHLFFESICTSSQKNLTKLGIKEDRLDSIQGGTLIFHLALNKFGAIEVITSGVGIREGVFLNDLLRNSDGRFPKNFNPSVRNIKDRFIKNKEKSKHTKLIMTKLLKTMQNTEIQPFYKHLFIASELSDIGISLNFYEKNHHGGYIVFNALNYALSHQDRLLIATLIKYINKKIPSILEYEELLPSSKILNILVFLLSLSDVLSYAKNPKLINITTNEDSLSTTINIQMEDSYITKEKLNKLNIPPFFKINLC